MENSPLQLLYLLNYTNVMSAVGYLSLYSGQLRQLQKACIYIVHKLITCNKMLGCSDRAYVLYQEHIYVCIYSINLERLFYYMASSILIILSIGNISNA